MLVVLYFWGLSWLPYVTWDDLDTILIATLVNDDSSLGTLRYRDAGETRLSGLCHMCDLPPDFYFDLGNATY